MSRIRSALLADLSQIPENEPVGVALSAGIDSTSVLICLMELQRKITVYSFTMAGWVSRDFAIARDNARRMGLRFVPVFLPQSMATLKEDLSKLIGGYHLRNKADIECAWPWLYMLKEVEEDHLATGLCSDAYFGLSRRAKLDFGDRLDEWRSMVYDKKPNYSQLVTIRTMAAKTGKTIWAPYRTDAMRHIFDGMNWKDLNQPREKMPIRQEFREEFQKFHFYPHTSLQLGDSRIAEHFAQLLHTDLNPDERYVSVRGIYNTLYEKSKPGPRPEKKPRGAKRAEAATLAMSRIAKYQESVGTQEGDDDDGSE